jgi:hypothetical protein
MDARKDKIAVPSVSTWTGLVNGSCNSIRRGASREKPPSGEGSEIQPKGPTTIGHYETLSLGYFATGFTALSSPRVSSSLRGPGDVRSFDTNDH